MKIDVRGFKIIYDHIWVGNVREINPKNNIRVLEEGPKTVGMAVPGRPQMTQQSMANRGYDTPSKGVINGDFTMGEGRKLFQSL